jgi:hypothetical protein
MKRLPLFLLASGLGAFILVLGNMLNDAVLDEPLRVTIPFGFIDAVDVLVLHFTIATTPFLPLAVSGNKRRKLWLLALLLSALTYVYGAWQIWQDSLNNFAGGANIGAGLIMMTMPIVSAIIVTVISRKTSRSAT